VTPAEGKRQRARLLRDIAAQAKKDARALLASLKRQIHAAKAAHRVARKKAQARCRVLRIEARARILDERARMLRELRELGARERSLARGTCDARKTEAKGLGSRTATARAALEAEKTYRRQMKTIEAGNRAKAKSLRRGPKKAERRSESDDQVEGNIPPEFVSLFRRVRGQIRASDRETRTEAFLQYAHDHPDEVLAAIDDRTDDVVRELEARERTARRDLNRPRRAASGRGEAAPF
jgi:hypothetical protein